MFPIEPNTIDAEAFIDEDGQAYMVWQLRHMAKLKPDLLSPDGPTITIPTKRDGYSEGPFLTKRKGIYYYFYTLGGDEAYQYAYMMSRTSPLGPWEAPEQDIIATTDHEEKVLGRATAVSSIRKAASNGISSISNMAAAAPPGRFTLTR